MQHLPQVEQPFLSMPMMRWLPLCHCSCSGQPAQLWAVRQADQLVQSLNDAHDKTCAVILVCVNQSSIAISCATLTCVRTALMQCMFQFGTNPKSHTRFKMVNLNALIEDRCPNHVRCQLGHPNLCVCSISKLQRAERNFLDSLWDFTTSPSG